MRFCFSFLAILALTTAGCQGPIATGGFYHSPYRSYSVDGPGPGVISEEYQPMSFQSPADCPPMAPEMYAGPIMGGGPMGGMACPPCVQPTSQVNFIGLEGLTINWDVRMPGLYDSEPLVCPGTYDFGQGNIFRFKLSNIPGRQGKELYPTLEIAPTMARTQAFLAHNAIPVEFTDTDFDQVLSGNFITKVIYLPNPEYQGLAMAGVGTLVNTQLEPGVDPIAEASNRGAILAIIRMGNKDLGMKTAELQRHGMMPGMEMQQRFVQGMPFGAAPYGVAMPHGAASSIPQNPISGVNIAPYGTPMTKTTTDIPGPPQLPQGQYPPSRYPIIRAEPVPAAPSQQPGATYAPQQGYGVYPQYGYQQPGGMMMQHQHAQHQVDMPSNATIVSDRKVQTYPTPNLAPMTNGN